jgi:Tfp pilus assembly protein PilX
MKSTRASQRNTRREQAPSGGFTLIASLLMLLLLSGIAIGLLMMANTESKVGGTDLQNNIAYHAAEGGIEKMYSDLTAVFQNAQAPTTSRNLRRQQHTAEHVGSQLERIFGGAQARVAARARRPRLRRTGTRSAPDPKRVCTPRSSR